jgi:hypothetical protein
VTPEVELRREIDAAHSNGQTDFIDIRTWCLDCYDRREPWVLRSLTALGVEFRHRVLEEAGVCHSCRTALSPGLHAVVVAIPLRRPSLKPSREDRA